MNIYFFQLYYRENDKGNENHFKQEKQKKNR